MKHTMLATSFAILLSGCQSPIVAVRNFSFDSKFTVDGKLYDLKSPYACHHEDLTWISERGSDWHIREGDDKVRIVGTLDDGSVFEVLPYSSLWRFSFCKESTSEINARLYIDSKNNLIESFDKIRNTSSIHSVQLISTKTTLIDSSLDTFVDHHNWPKPTAAAKRYYTVRATIYENKAWNNRPEIVDLIRSKEILWLEKGKPYPFTVWSQNDVALARTGLLNKIIDGNADSTATLYLVPNGESWLFSGSKHNAIQWIIEPLPSNPSEERGAVISSKFKQWVVYEGTNIELPLRSYYRVFYEPEYDRLIKFEVEHVNLW